MIVGLTGGIGSGKTTVAKLFQTMGCIIYNSDERAKELYFNPEVKQQVIHLLGDEAYLNDTELNRDFISKKVFSNTLLLHQLNAIIHPAVKKDFEQFVNQFPLNRIIIKETAILFEIGIQKDLDYSILVTASVETKTNRVMKRNHISKEEVEKRMHAQWTDEQKIPLADFVIYNNPSDALIPQVLKVIENLNKHVQA